MWPQVFDAIYNTENIAFYAHFGVSLLLFMVGLWLNPAIIKEVGKVASIAWVWQVLFTSVVGFGLSLLMGFELMTSVFIAIALTFSSTIVIVKLVSDRGDSWTTYGKIALWVLIVQDIIAMMVLLVISTTTMSDGMSWILVVRIITVVAFLLYIAWVASKYFLPRILKALSSEKELMLLFIITWAILLGGLWYYAWFSMEIGALLAGVTLASSRYRFHIFSELRPFRDFFLALFFVYLWGQIVFDNIGTIILPIVLFSVFVLIGNPTIITILMLRLWYGRKDSFMTGLTVAQISEFSFIIIGLALTAGILEDPIILSLVTIIWLITMTGSSYMFANADKIFSYVWPLFKRFERVQEMVSTEPIIHENTDSAVVIIGYGRLGQFMASKLKQHQIPFCIVDNQSDKIQLAQQVWHTVVYGDINDNDLLIQLVWDQTEVVYITIEDHDVTIHALGILKQLKIDVKVIALALYHDEAETLYNHNADYVIFPHMSGANESREILEQHVWQPNEFIASKKASREALYAHKKHVH